MTTPFDPITQNNRIGSPIDQEEWDLMLERRRQLVEEITNRMNLANKLGSMDVADTVATVHNLHGQNEDGSPTRFQDYNSPPPGHELNQLLGAAKYYGIADADKIPPMRLKQIIEAQRLKTQPLVNEGGVLKKAGETVAEGVVALGLGTINELLNVAQKLPFVGDAFARSKVVQGVDQYFGIANEAVQANMTQDEASGFRTASRIGGMVGYALPASGAWMAAGAAGKVGFVANAGRVLRLGPLARAAVQGAASTALIETGDPAGFQWHPPESVQEKMWKIGMGAAAGAGFTYLEGAVPRVFEKIRGAFRGKTDPFAPGYEPVQPPGEDMADWYFEADHQLAGPPGPPNGGGAVTRPMEPAPFGDDPFMAARPATAKMAEQPGAPAGPDYTVEPLNPELPGQPKGELMSPQRAAIEERLNTLTEQRDVARRAIETDPLTGTGNRVALMRAKEAVDADPELGWAVFDGKQFKAVNDTHGHSVGDGVLANFSRAIGQAAQELNIPNRVFRQGGDEFAAVAPKTQLDALVQRATELSYQKVGAVETKLNGYHADTFDAADLQLMSNKRGGVYREADVQAEIDKALSQHLPNYSVQLGMAPAEAAAEGATLSKQATLMETGDIAHLAQASEITVADVAQTSMARNPGGISVIRGIGDAGKTIRQLVQARSEFKLMPHNFRLVERSTPETLTGVALKNRITNEVISQPGFAQGHAALARDPYAPEYEAGFVTSNERYVGREEAKQIALSRQQLLDPEFVPGPMVGAEQLGPAQMTSSMDLLISDGLPITNKRASQYKEFGFFEGQTAMVKGQEVVVKTPGPTYTTVVDPYSGESSQVRTREVLPGNATSALSGQHISEVYPKAGDLYNEFVSFAMDAMNAGSETLGIVDKPTWLDHETATQLPRMLDDFLDSRGITNVTERHAIEAFFNAQRVEDYRMEAPEEAAELAGIVRELNTAVVAKPPVSIPIEDIAATKGFNYIPMAGEPGGFLTDQLSDLRVPVESPEAALEFLRAFNREVPDYTPESEIPFELVSAGPHGASPGDATEPTYEGGDEQVLAITNREIGRVTKQVQQTIAHLNGVTGLSVPGAGGGGAGGSLPPTPPPPPPPPVNPPGAPGPASPAPRSLGAAFAQAQQNNPAQLYKALQMLDSAWLQYGEPFRRVTIRIQDALQGMGIQEGKLWEHYSDMVTAIARKHNEEHPWMEEAVDIFSNFTKRRWLRDGSVMRIHEISNYQHRLAAMQNAGYTAKDIATQNRIDGYYDRFMSSMVNAQGTVPGISRQLFNYTAAVRQRQAMNVSDPYKDVNNHLGPDFKIFAEIAAKNNLIMKQLDARTLPTALIRGVMFQKHAEAPWQAMNQAWNDPRVPEKLRTIVTDWLQVVKHGRDPSYDVATQGIRYVLNRIGVPITDAEVMGIWNGAFSNIYRGALGGRPDAIFRDSIQPLLAGTRIGFKPIASAYNRYLSGKTARDAMWQRAYAGGWVEEGQVQVPIAEIFEGPIQNIQGANLLTPNAQSRRDMLAAIGDLAYAMTPVRLRGGIQGTLADPLLGYTKLGEFNRLISGDAGWQVANDALQDYAAGMQKVFATQQGPQAVQQMNDLMARLMDKSMADVYPQPIQNKFTDLVNNGDFAGAANLLANEAANSQFRYGSKESSIGIRKAGTVGRMGMMFGSFTQQYIAGMREQFLGVPKSPTRTAKVSAMALRHGSIMGLLGLAGAYTGWKFSKWLWHNSLAFGGGPMGTSIYEGVQYATGKIAQATGQGLSPQQSMAVARTEAVGPSDILAGAASTVFPYSSTVETVNRLSTSTQGLNPVEATGRVLVTGERGLGPDFRQYFENQYVVTPDDLNNALAGDTNAAEKFSPEDRQFIQRLAMVPAERRFQIYMNWRDSRRQGPMMGNGMGAGGRY